MEIANWIQSARKGTIKTLAKDAFRERWISWWSRCNPAWRERAADGHPVIGGTGDWSMMFIPGKNGFVNIIASLYTLAETMDVDSWARSVRDVRWVLTEVLAARRATRYVPLVIYTYILFVIIAPPVVPPRHPKLPPTSGRRRARLPPALLLRRPARVAEGAHVATNHT